MRITIVAVIGEFAEGDFKTWYDFYERSTRNWDLSFENNNNSLYYEYRELRIPSATLLFQVWFVMERKKKKRKKTELLYTYIQKKKRTPERVCCHGSFSPLPLVTVRNATERDAPVVLCSLVSPLWHDRRTHILMVSAREIILGKILSGTEAFSSTFVTPLSSHHSNHNLKSISFFF